MHFQILQKKDVLFLFPQLWEQHEIPAFTAQAVKHIRNFQEEKT